MKMFKVRETEEATAHVMAVPLVIQRRIQVLYQRLARWPDVSGAKPLRGSLHGAYRLRTGDYRVLFRVNQAANLIVVFRIAHRRDVYEE